MVFPILLIELALVVVAILGGGWAFGSILDAIKNMWPVVAIAVIGIIAHAYLNYKREGEKAMWEAMKYQMLLKRATKK